ncbi:MAG TPA: YIP1 family protein [Anaeromyxobacter sp.]|nr:YIP1 family protein [Anaeromyxobacter sp.]
MIGSELSTDGAVLARALVSPASGLARVAGRGRAGLAIAVATAAALASAAVIVPRVDYGAAAEVQVKPGEEPTPFEREQAAATARKIGQIRGWAGAAALPALAALAAASLLSLGFRVAGARPGFRPTLAVTAHGLLPVWLAGILAIPAAIARAPIPPDQAAQLLPSSLAALLPPGAPGPLAAALSGLDLFALASLWLVSTGMARAAGTSRARALAVTVLLFVAWIALLRVVPAALAANAPPPRPGP